MSKPQRHHKRSPAGLGIEALAIQVGHGAGNIVTRCNSRFGMAVWASYFHPLLLKIRRLFNKPILTAASVVLVVLVLLMLPFCVIGDRLQRGEEAVKRELE